MQRPPIPPFSLKTALAKVKAAEDSWITRDPERVAKAYTAASEWRNRDELFQGRAAARERVRPSWRARPREPGSNNQDNDMRFIQIKGVGGFLSWQQKAELISEITNVVDAVYGEGLRQATRVAIEEIPSGSTPDHRSPKRTSGGSPAGN